MMTSTVEINVGDSFDRLTIIRRLKNDKGGNARWRCKCACGGIIELLAVNLRSGDTRSCGCLRKEALTKHSHTKNYRRSPTYFSWEAMKCRCLNQNHKSYKNYGGRGIGICDRWLNSFEDFLADMGERPEGKTLDRYPDNDGGYEPRNCRWATITQQNSNQRNRCIA